MIEEQVVQIIADDRESRSGLIEKLQNYEYTTTSTHVMTNVEVTRLEVGDLILSDRCGVERKSTADFVDSFINRDLFGQVADLSRSFSRPIVVLEGDSVFGIRDVHPNALRSALTAITVGWGVPLLPTRNIDETAAMAVSIAFREQYPMRRGISIPHTKRSSMSLSQRQRYVISSIGGGVGSKVAADLLEHFKSVQAVIDAPVDEMMKVNGVGKKTAERIRDVVGGEYLPSEERGKA